jgi:hypothetical protein
MNSHMGVLRGAHFDFETGSSNPMRGQAFSPRALETWVSG